MNTRGRHVRALAISARAGLEPTLAIFQPHEAPKQANRLIIDSVTIAGL
jgi:hypothetical protein